MSGLRLDRSGKELSRAFDIRFRQVVPASIPDWKYREVTARTAIEPGRSYV
jgi:hypothetical protein